MNPKRCINCGKKFKPAPQATKQTYCASTECQKQRRRVWQKNKLLTDPDYRENQALAQKAWANRNQDYWRHYREAKRNHENLTCIDPKWTANGQDLQNIKMDSSASHIPFADGLFILKVIAHGPNEKMDSWIVEITRFHAGSKSIMKIAKR
jgi:hypothetical protein